MSTESQKPEQNGTAKTAKTADYSRLMSEIRCAFNGGKTRSVDFRIKQLENLKRMYEENEELLCDALKRDLRKSRMEAMGTEIDFLKNDIIGCLREIRHENLKNGMSFLFFYISFRHWVKIKYARKTVPTLLDNAFIKPEPYGVVLIIGAWNYPLNVTLAPLSAAISAGNCAVIKPSEISPHTAKCIEELIPKYLDPMCFKVTISRGNLIIITFINSQGG